MLVHWEACIPVYKTVKARVPCRLWVPADFRPCLQPFGTSAVTSGITPVTLVKVTSNLVILSNLLFTCFFLCVRFRIWTSCFEETKNFLITTIRFSCSKSISCFWLQVHLEGSKAVLFENPAIAVELILVKECISVGSLMSLCCVWGKQSCSWWAKWDGRWKYFSYILLTVWLEMKIENNIVIRVVAKAYLNASCPLCQAALQWPLSQEDTWYYLSYYFLIAWLH